MTETKRPTQADLCEALHTAKLHQAPDSRLPENMKRVLRTLLALAAENKALEERVRVLRKRTSDALDMASDPDLQQFLANTLGADEAKVAGEPPVAVSADVAKSLTTLLHPASDDRASRRRAYMRDKAPVILAGMLNDGKEHGDDYDDSDVYHYRRLAIEQAGLIFDETEQGDG